MNLGDIAIDNPNTPTLMQVTLKASKTDPCRKGVNIFLGNTSTELCPVAAMLAFMAVRGCQQGFLFTFQAGHYLTKARFIQHVRLALQAAGFNCKKYSGHSFRIGVATMAHAKGFNDSTIKMLGRWESNAYLMYVKTPRQSLAKFSSQLMAGPQ